MGGTSIAGIMDGERVSRSCRAGDCGAKDCKAGDCKRAGTADAGFGEWVGVDFGIDVTPDCAILAARRAAIFSTKVVLDPGVDSMLIVRGRGVRMRLLESIGKGGADTPIVPTSCEGIEGNELEIGRDDGRVGD